MMIQSEDRTKVVIKRTKKIIFRGLLGHGMGHDVHFHVYMVGKLISDKGMVRVYLNPLPQPPLFFLFKPPLEEKPPLQGDLPREKLPLGALPLCCDPLCSCPWVGLSRGATACEPATHWSL
jgi:hypothetical protein